LRIPPIRKDYDPHEDQGNVYQRFGKRIKYTCKGSHKSKFIPYCELPEDLKGVPEFQELKPIHNALNILEQGPDAPLKPDNES
jgi:hypothetical protein